MEITNQYKFKFLLAKAYFDKGYGITNYFFKLVAVFGLTTQMAKATFYILGAYTLACYFIGRYWYQHQYIDVENDITNLFNPFQREVRKKLGIPNN